MRLSIWRYLKSFKFSSLYVNYVSLLLLLLVLPLSAYFFVSYYFYNNLFESEIANTNIGSLSRASYTMDMTVSSITSQINWLALDSNVLLFMNESGNNDSIAYDPSKIIYLLNMFVSTSNFVDSVYVFSDNSKNIISLQSGGNIKDFYDNSWYEDYKKNKSKMFWIRQRKIYTNDNAEGKDVISLFQSVNYYNKDAGLVVVNIDTERLSSFLKTAAGQMENIVFYDAEGKKLYPSSEVPDLPSYEYIKTLDLTSPQYIVKNDKGGAKLLTFIKSENTGWVYISGLKLVNYGKKIIYIRNFMLTAVGVTILISILLALIISTKIFKPVENIMSEIEKASGDTGVQYATTKYHNEVAFIIDTISKTIGDNKKIASELESRLKLLQKAQMVALQAQINPHFLYNTLLSIRWMAMEFTDGDNKVSDAIASLAGLLQIGLEDSSQFTTVDKELKHVKLYLEIQKMRYKNKFEVKWEIDPDILNYKMVKIILQPIVENAIYHGIKPKEGRGLIIIAGYKDGDNLVFDISDNGVGMTAQAIEALKLESESDYFENFTNIGIKNANQRLKLIFGMQYGIKIDSEMGKGTVIHIIMPAMK